MSPRTLIRRRFILIGGWLLFTVSLAVWWLIFGLRQLEAIKSIETADASKLIEYQTMLMVEGLSLVVSLLAGGIALCWLVLREESERKRITDFFSVFSHELKTPLSSIQLQAESLRSKLTDTGGAQVASRLLQDTQRLLLQLENALMSADDRFRLVLETIELEPFLKNMALSWPSLQISVVGNAKVIADMRALTAITQNIFNNSIFHGKATVVTVNIVPVGKQVQVSFEDNGKGFSGDIKKLGVAFKRHYQGSGSGIGLAIVKSLLSRMGGSIEVQPAAQGFKIKVTLRSDEANTIS